MLSYRTQIPQRLGALSLATATLAGLTAFVAAPSASAATSMCPGNTYSRIDSYSQTFVEAPGQAWSGGPGGTLSVTTTSSSTKTTTISAGATISTDELVVDAQATVSGSVAQSLTTNVGVTYSHAIPAGNDRHDRVRLVRVQRQLVAVARERRLQHHRAGRGNRPSDVHCRLRVHPTLGFRAVQAGNKKIVTHVNALTPRYLLRAAAATMALALAGCSASGNPSTQQPRTSALATLGASASTSAAWQSSALPVDSTTLWRQPDKISNQKNTDLGAAPGTYTLAVECVGAGTLTLTLTAGNAKPVSATADCAPSGNTRVTAVMKSSADVASTIAVSARAEGSMVWRLSRV